MKETIANTMFSTCAALLLFAIFKAITGDNSIYVNTVFEIFGANIVINFGLILIQKFESPYAILEYLVDISYILLILIIFGVIFNWYSTLPVYVLVIMGIAVYVFAVILSFKRINKYTQEINGLLEKRKTKKSDIVS